MAKRGRKSAAELAVVGGTDVETMAPPNPPLDLTGEQVEEWMAIVRRCPPDWFPRETHGMLAQMCRHIVAGRRIAELIRQIEAKEHLDLDEYDRALKMQERESRAMTALARSLRLTLQSQYSESKAKPKKTFENPWDE